MDQQNSESIVQTPEVYREIGKSLLNSTDLQQRSAGISSLLKAYDGGDPEAAYIVGDLMLQGVLKPTSGDTEECALSILCKAARKGNVQARALLNSHCMNCYSAAIDPEEKTEGPLLDFDGKAIKIKRTGVLTPVDAVLEYIDGVNLFTLSVNIMFVGDDELDNCDNFKNAVCEGIMMWAGEYRVFGNQHLKVNVNLTTENRVFDNVLVIPMTDMMEASVQNASAVIARKTKRENIESLLADKRSFAAGGLRWSSKSRKMIFIQSEDGKFDDYEEIKHMTKHEFGHALGLGDLYENRTDRLEGVKKGTYSDLDGFYLYNKFYNLVMCDHHAPISNNDIEMVILAFRENRAQLYQPSLFKGKISKALGRGN